MAHVIFARSCAALNSLQLQVDAPLHAGGPLPAGLVLLNSFHLTLARLDDQGKALSAPVSLPLPDFAIELADELYLVDSGEKRSCYVPVTPQCAERLRGYVRECGVLLGLPDIAESNRTFHVTLANAIGGDAVRASVGSVWDWPAQLVEAPPA